MMGIGPHSSPSAFLLPLRGGEGKLASAKPWLRYGEARDEGWIECLL